MTQAENLASKAAVRFAGYRSAWEGGDLIISLQLVAVLIRG
jgi:hypothetical protein